MNHDDAVRARFAQNSEAFIEHTRAQVEPLREQLATFLAPLRGDERVLDAGTGPGTLALALAPLGGEVVGVDLVPELLVAARTGAPTNATFLEGDATALAFDNDSFDLACSRRTLHHVGRPEVAVAELARVTKRGGRVLVDDQIAPADPLKAFELDRFERRRDASHHRTLSDGDIRDLFAANDLTLERSEHFTQRRELDDFLARAGCVGDEAEAVKALSPGDREHYVVETAWYLCVKR
jgi:ubiquinone/menaquinone biosynthesis C-methylase UbiE